MNESKNHPIDNMLAEVLKNIKSIVDVNTVVGDAYTTENGTTLIPVAKVSIGFVGGGGEHSTHLKKHKNCNYPLLFGSGAGVTVNPVGFIVEEQGTVRYIKSNETDSTSIILNMITDIIKNFKK